MIDYELIASQNLVKGTNFFWDKNNKLSILLNDDVIYIGIDKEEYMDITIDNIYNIIKNKLADYLMVIERKNKLNKINGIINK